MSNISAVSFEKLLAVLFDTSQPRLVYLSKALLLSIIPAILISILLGLLFPDSELPEFPGNAVVLFFGVVIFSPLLETLLLWAGVSFFGLFTKSTWTIALLSATAWAVLHSLSALTWGFVIFWSFVVMSIAFIEWRKLSRKEAFWMTSGIHAAQNFLAYLLILAG